MTLTQALHRVSICAAAALLVVAVGARPVFAAATPSPQTPETPPPQDTKKDHKKKVQKKKDKQGSSLELRNWQIAHEKFVSGYRAAHELIQAGKYDEGIAAMHALGHDEHPDVANYIGYAERRLGKYDESKYWYEKALAADPQHVRTWSYYGMWQMEQGNRLKAEDYLAKVKLICGDTNCTEYKQLKDVIDGKASY